MLMIWCDPAEWPGSHRPCQPHLVPDRPRAAAGRADPGSAGLSFCL